MEEQQDLLQVMKEQQQDRSARQEIAYIKKLLQGLEDHVEAVSAYVMCRVGKLEKFFDNGRGRNS